MATSPRRFVWYELLTTDTDAAKDFYGKVVGWGTKDAPMPGVTYGLFTSGDTPAAGVMALPEEARRMNVPPGWIGYVEVDDLDAAADQVERLGGTVHVGPRDIPAVGRFAVVADPQGATLALFKGAQAAPPPPADPAAPGRVGWHELLAADWPKVFPFYADTFGWGKGDAVDLGPMGTYQLFTAGEQPIGGMFNKLPAMPAPYWLYYFNVGDIDAAAHRATDAGGRILHGPMQVPGGNWVLQATDPQGGMFALAGPKQ